MTSLFVVNKLTEFSGRSVEPRITHCLGNVSVNALYLELHISRHNFLEVSLRYLGGGGGGGEQGVCPRE